MRLLFLINIVYLMFSFSGHKNASELTTPGKVKVNNSASEDSLHIFLVRQRWHTGILFDIQKVDTLIWPEITEMKDFGYIDVGWGDEDFYQYPGFDAGLAVKALFYPTPSVLRIHGFNISSFRYAELSDVAVKIYLNRSQFDSICRYISLTYVKDSKNQPIQAQKTSSERTIFYKAVGKYHLFNTCNTWVAKGLLKAGFDLNPSEIIFSEDLFQECVKFGFIISNKHDQE